MDDLLAEFIAETREMLEAIGGELVAWEGDPANRDRLDTIFRFVHTVKGNCGFFDFPRLEQLSHAAEDALADCRAGRREPDSALVSAVLAVIDRIGDIVTAIEAGGDLDHGGDAELIAALASDDHIAPIPANDITIPAPNHTLTPEAGKPHRTVAVQRSIRLPVDLLDEVMKGVSDMVLARNDLAHRLRDAGTQPGIDGPFERLSATLAHVRTAITRMRMQRLEHLFTSLPRLVRDLSAELGKQVMVDFEGGDVELDREMIEMVRDPLTHIIRNAIDHGIEGPGARIKAGKREIGLMKFAARQSGNQITLIISDDGKGIDTDRLAQKAVAAGLYTQAEIDTMSPRRRLALVFAAGLSTADKVSAVSGRGVGMDVVRANIEKIGGAIDIVSTPGQGTTVTLQLPLTLSIIATLTVQSHSQRYAIARSHVEEIVFGGSAQVEFAQAGDRQLVTFRGRRVPCLALSEILGTQDLGDINWHDCTLVLVRMPDNALFALAVDRVLDHEDVVVKPIAPAIMQTGLYTGTTLLDDGRPMMMLDLPSIAVARQIGGEQDCGALAEEEVSATNEQPATPVMIFTGLDGRRRAVRLELVRRIDTIAPQAIDIDGTRAQAVVDGRILTLVGHDRGPLPAERCRLLRLSDGSCELAHIVREVVDATEIRGQIVPSAGDPTIEGVVLIDERPVPVIDGHSLFAEHAHTTPPALPLTCRVPVGSEWSRTILEPLVTAAGYRILSDDEEREADVAIQLADGPAPVDGPARRVIRLRPTPEQSDPNVDTIYRYDRDGLLAALRQLRRGDAA